MGVCIKAQLPNRRKLEREHTFIDKDQAEVISGRILLVNLSEGRCKVEATEEESDGNCFTSRW